MLKSVYDCSVIELPRIENAKGNITPVHSGINLPFEIARIFYLLLHFYANCAKL